MNIFTKVITKISQLFSKQISVFTTKSILRNQARSARLVFIVAISISFMLLASTVAYSEEQYQKGVQTIETGDGIVINFYSNDMNSSNLEMYSDVFWNKSIELQLQGVNYMYYPQEAGLWEDGEYKQIEYNSDFYGYYGTLPAAVITAQNYSEFIDLQDNWFVRSTAQNMMDKLANTPNAAMMPDFLMNKGYNVGDVIQIRYSSNSTNYTIQDFTIVGFYKYFPLTGNSWYSSGITPIILDIGSIEKAKVGSVKMIIYSDLETAPTPSELISLLQDYDSNIRQMYDYDYGFGINVSDMYLRLMRSITRFLDLESYYMLFIVVAGVGIIMYISIREKSHDMGILRARGIDRGVVFKIQLAEGTTLILLGLIFSLIGIFGAKAILLEFDTLFGYFSSLERDLLVPWGKIAIQLLISLALFVGITGIAVKIESKQSNIGPISELLRIQ